MKIAFLKTGLTWLPVARRPLEARHVLNIWNRMCANAEPLISQSDVHGSAELDRSGLFVELASRNRKQ